VIDDKACSYKVTHISDQYFWACYVDGQTHALYVCDAFSSL